MIAGVDAGVNGLGDGDDGVWLAAGTSAAGLPPILKTRVYSPGSGFSAFFALGIAIGEGGGAGVGGTTVGGAAAAGGATGAGAAGVGGDAFTAGRTTVGATELTGSGAGFDGATGDLMITVGARSDWLPRSRFALVRGCSVAASASGGLFSSSHSEKKAKP